MVGSLRSRQFVFDILLYEVWIGSDNPTAIDEDRRRAGDLHSQAIGAAGVNGGGGLRAG